ncbi:mediator of RNA polymerase II transcription subunit 17-like [Dendronephthya gigantea]|uniref:mediator of RNA polymerase II transcription subunit 17-like n=1 Tax=Dendronephthya gigantea TaxID=151771 RepID=UPI00106D0452|nr:mediator of RNA polymerase II transcription subunit 17-like [Dendronephthya gigantea]
MASSMPIAVEQLLESRVQEISRDGQETYVPQLSMTEKLAQLAHKIDFGKTQDEDEELTQDESDKPLFQPSLWPWDSVRNKLRNTLTNLSVLLDVLSVARDKKYISLDAVSQGEAPPKPAVRLLSKRKNFADASKILLLGMKDMAAGLNEQRNKQQNEQQNEQQNKQQSNSNQRDFHMELMKLRQKWRLKRSGNLILGDLSYKSAGSKFWHAGAFEVKKETNTEEGTNNLDVNISSDLLGVSEVQVRIVYRDSPSTSGNHINSPSYTEGVAPWHKELCIAQNNLFCKELYAQLAHESYHSKGLFARVVNNVIETEIFPKTTMSITHVHRTDDFEEGEMAVDKPRGSLEVLDVALHILLRQQHRSSCGHETPRPVTSGFAMRDNRKYRVAGPSCMVLNEVTQYNISQRLLDKLIKIAKHHILTTRIASAIQELSDEIHDPLISCHWSSLSTESSSFASIYIGLENRVERTCLAVKVDVETVHITQHDGVGVTFSADVHELKLMLRNQVQLFMLEVVKKAALRLGWNVRFNTFLGTRSTTAREEHLVGLLLTCPEKEREVLIEISPPSKVKIKVKSPQYGGAYPRILENEPKWSSISRNYNTLNYENTPGRTFLEKLTIILQAS